MVSAGRRVRKSRLRPVPWYQCGWPWPLAGCECPTRPASLVRNDRKPRRQPASGLRTDRALEVRQVRADPVLIAACDRAPASWAEAEHDEPGALIGSSGLEELARAADKYVPALLPHSPHARACRRHVAPRRSPHQSQLRDEEQEITRHVMLARQLPKPGHGRPKKIKSVAEARSNAAMFSALLRVAGGAVRWGCGRGGRGRCG